MPKRKKPSALLKTTESENYKDRIDPEDFCFDNDLHCSEPNSDNESLASSITSYAPSPRSFMDELDVSPLSFELPSTEVIQKPLARTEQLIYACSICKERFPHYEPFKLHVEAIHKKKGDPVDFVDLCALRIYDNPAIRLELTAHCGDRRLSILKMDSGERAVITGALIPKGEIVVQYAGDLVDLTEFKLRKKMYGNAGIFLRLNQPRKIQFIDATINGNCSRFIRHGHGHPHANVHSLVTRFKDSRKVVLVYAKRNIAVGEEIKMDYNFFHVPTREDLYNENNASSS